MDSLTIQRIIDTANIVDVVSDFVTLHKRGVNFVGLCPFHDEKTPSFYVSPSKGICKCFSCGKGGNAIHFLMEHEQMSFNQAAEWLAKKYGIPFQHREYTDKEKELHRDRESMFIINQFAADFFTDSLYSDRGRAIGLSYLKNRKFRDDIIKKFQLGLIAMAAKKKLLNRLIYHARKERKIVPVVDDKKEGAVNNKVNLLIRRRSSSGWC